MKTPIPFSETTVSPGKLSKWYTIIPNNKKFITILTLLLIICLVLFLNDNKDIKDIIPDPIKRNGIVTYNNSLFLNREFK